MTFYSGANCNRRNWFFAAASFSFSPFFLLFIISPTPCCANPLTICFALFLYFLSWFRFYVDSFLFSSTPLPPSLHLFPRQIVLIHFTFSRILSLFDVEIFLSFFWSQPPFAFSFSSVIVSSTKHGRESHRAFPYDSIKLKAFSVRFWAGQRYSIDQYTFFVILTKFQYNAIDDFSSFLFFQTFY